MSQEDLGTPILETDLEAGDLLYLPRGTIHQVQIVTFLWLLFMLLYSILIVSF